MHDRLLKKPYASYGPGTSTQKVCFQENKLLLTPQDAAHMLSLAPRTIYALVETGKLPCVRIGRSVRIPRKAIMEMAGEKE